MSVRCSIYYGDSHDAGKPDDPYWHWHLWRHALNGRYFLYISGHEDKREDGDGAGEYREETFTIDPEAFEQLCFAYLRSRGFQL